ncbi:MAG: TAT-variant-translocated molybdopterin oxidoreductase [Planctomycetaceae bacterium]|nr:TAT-variant-translocated molybdopterin oxidoreductase [Planctomycetaceae bacterium]
MAKHWRSLEEYYDQPSFREKMEREFPVAASMFPEGVSRRRWLQLMGASLTLAGVAGCRWEDQKIATYVKRPANRTPGVPVKYASMLERSGVACGVLVTSYDGRPIKVDVNREHPQGFRGTDLFAQASVLGLYDPDRIARDPKTGGFDNLYDSRQENVVRQKTGEGRAARSWADFTQFLGSWRTEAEASQGAGVCVLAGASSSPTRYRLQQEFSQKFPAAKWVEYEPVSRDREQQGIGQALGQPARLRYNVAAADVIVGLDSDLLDFHPDALRHIGEWSSRRIPEQGEMNRTYVVESCYSSLGQNADHRFPLASSQVAVFLADLRDAVQAHLGGAADAHAPEDSRGAFLHAVVDDLVSHQGRSLLVAGPRQPAEVHAICLELNGLLGNLGKTVVALANQQVGSQQPQAEQLQGLVADLKSGAVKSLMILGGNPAYDVPAEFGLAELIAQVPVSVRLGLYDDETSDLCSWYLPEAHDLEAWGDGRSWDGTVTLRQPLIEPLHRGWSDIEFLATLLGRDVLNGQGLVRETLDRLKSGLTERNWQQVVHDGFLAGSAWEPAAATVASGVSGALTTWLSEYTAAASVEGSSGVEVVFLPDECVYDGRFANNAWLQETPAPLTKVTWDNVAVISPKTAQARGLKDGELVRLNRGDATIQVPVMQVPGVADNTFGITLGYGRTMAGHVGGGAQGVAAPGVSAYQLIGATGAGFETGVDATSTGQPYVLATTQDHWAIDVAGMEEIGRRVGALVREGTQGEYSESPEFAEHRVHMPPRLESLWEERNWDGDYQWGMSIDLTRCVGCNACTVACQSENNVPVVGKDQVNRNREMHWIRIDRYFVGDPEHPGNVGVSTQPVTCQQCENAPCEQVCPVAATVHSEEGLNDMAYNRCVGTRYCANNCPYKVRRFNYYSNAIPLMQKEQELVQLTMNPEVTIRSRGVMEKCTYCVQRIQNGKIAAKNARRLVQDGEIETACQEACPADAIVFGNLQDEKSQVFQLHHNPRSYAMLGELNVKPRTQYLARVRNPHPSLQDQYFVQPGEHHGHGEHHGEEHGEHHDEAHGHDDHGHGADGHGPGEHGAVHAEPHPAPAGTSTTAPAGTSN